ncbi:hypothetical protein AVEN_25660-1 [Araneus ventricosus]|uniref:Uncharacterized protein n=1 Tax=Araneus ventricosus TaxID=182803 RepID=A0A4Y2BQF9_ARAVE|nr:hypothetical protein AVEN_25660-1 [Araneus ventricosus]
MFQSAHWILCRSLGSLKRDIHERSFPRHLERVLLDSSSLQPIHGGSIQMSQSVTSISQSYCAYNSSRFQNGIPLPISPGKLHFLTTLQLQLLTVTELSINKNYMLQKRYSKLQAFEQGGKIPAHQQQENGGKASGRSKLSKCDAKYIANLKTTNTGTSRSDYWRSQTKYADRQESTVTLKHMK